MFDYTIRQILRRGIPAHLRLGLAVGLTLLSLLPVAYPHRSASAKAPPAVARSNGLHALAAGLTGQAPAPPVEGAPELRIRDFSSDWVDGKGRIWIFGGYGKDSDGIPGFLNDLWLWDGTRWVLLAGSLQGGQAGIYGSQDAAGRKPCPGARVHPTTWIGKDGTLWLRGGYGRDSTGRIGILDDLWKWDGTRWSWVAGSDTVVEPSRRDG